MHEESGDGGAAGDTAQSHALREADTPSVSRSQTQPTAETEAEAATPHSQRSRVCECGFQSIYIDGNESSELDDDFVQSAGLILSAMQARHRYKDMDQGQQEDPSKDDEAADDTRDYPAPDTTTRTPSARRATLEFAHGVFRFDGMRTTLITWEQFADDLATLYALIESGPCLSTARTRLTALSEKFRLYSLLNNEAEVAYARAAMTMMTHTACESGRQCDAADRATVGHPTREGAGDGRCGEDGRHHRHHRIAAEAASTRGADAPSVRTGNRDSHAVRTGDTDAHAPCDMFDEADEEEEEEEEEDVAHATTHADATHTPSPGSARDACPVVCMLDHVSYLDSLPGAGAGAAVYGSYTRVDTGLSLSARCPTAWEGEAVGQRAESDGPDIPLDTDPVTHGAPSESMMMRLLRERWDRQERDTARRCASEVMLPLDGRRADACVRLAGWLRRQRLLRYTRIRWNLALTPPLGADGSLAEVSQDTAVADGLYRVFYPLLMATRYPNDPAWSAVAEMLDGCSAMVVVPVSDTPVVVPGPCEAMVCPDAAPRWSSGRCDDANAAPDKADAGGRENDEGAGGGGGYGCCCCCCCRRRPRGRSAAWFCYLVWCNVAVLNALRLRHRRHPLRLTIDVDESAPAYDRLLCGFLLANTVLRARSLHKSWIMRYVFMLCRVGVVLAPLRDRARAGEYDEERAAMDYFRQGMQLSLSTADPLYAAAPPPSPPPHRSDSPLREVYATLMKLCRLSAMDCAELARNSVLHSNFPRRLQERWLGEGFVALGETGNDCTRSWVCDFRLRFRRACWCREMALLRRHGTAAAAVVAVAVGTTAPAAPPLPPDGAPVCRWMAYARVRVVPPDSARGRRRGGGGGSAGAVAWLREVVLLRAAYSHMREVDADVEEVFRHSAGFDAALWEYHNYTGIFLLSRVGSPPRWPECIPRVGQFVYDVGRVRRAGCSARLQRLCRHRLRLLERLHGLHVAMNRHAEAGGRLATSCNHRDFFTAHKVDTHIHTEAGCNARTLLDFFVEKAQSHGHDVVWEEQERPVTLRELLGRLRIDWAHITVDELHHQLRTHAGLRALFLSVENYMQGRYFAELTRRTVQMYREDVYSFAENRLTLRGARASAWASLAHWFDRYGMASSQIRWLVCFEQSYAELRGCGAVANFGDYLDHLFRPLWEVSLYPARDTTLHYFLAHVSGFDCVGAAEMSLLVPTAADSVRRACASATAAPWNRHHRATTTTTTTTDALSTPAASTSHARSFVVGHAGALVYDDEEEEPALPWRYPHDYAAFTNPPYNMYLYYLWANIVSLNAFRASRKLSTFTFRPHCGESGSMDHLIGGFLLAHGISHGVTLAVHPVMEYLYYLTQLGIAMSPLSNTAKAAPYLANPFPRFFHRGLNVSLATNRPLYFHLTREPLLEEYSIAAKLWHLELNDLAEIARNSVRQSGFPAAWKRGALGACYTLHSPLGNDVRYSHVSDIRVAYRFETYHSECDFLDAQLGPTGGRSMPRAMRSLAEERAVCETHAAWACAAAAGMRGQSAAARGLGETEQAFDLVERAATRPGHAAEDDADGCAHMARYTAPDTGGVVEDGTGVGVAALPEHVMSLSDELRRVQMCVTELIERNAHMTQTIHRLGARSRQEEDASV